MAKLDRLDAELTKLERLMDELLAVASADDVIGVTARHTDNQLRLVRIELEYAKSGARR
jgi:hypothetical protein